MYNIFLVLRKLQNFESPFVTIKHLHIIGSRVVLGKNYWDIGYDFKLMNNEVAMNLLYIQAVAEIQWGWISITDELKNQLTVLQKHGKKKEVWRNCVYTRYTCIHTNLNIISVSGYSAYFKVLWIYSVCSVPL